MLSSTLAKRTWLLLFLAVIAFYLYGLGNLPLVGPDEPRYAQVAREMFYRGDLITPTLGGMLWFEKPVLLYWMVMASYRLFGEAEWAIRLGPALSGLATIGAVYWVGRRVEATSQNPALPDFGKWAALVAATSMGMIVFSRGASFDIVVTMPITWAISFFIAWQLRPSERRSQLLLAGFYIFMAVALLAKGLIGIVIPLGTVGAFYLVRWKFPPRSLLLSLIWGLPLAAGVAAIWYGPVIARHGWLFIDEFFIQHHLARYVSNKYRHPQPFYFYFLILFPLTLPWIPFLVDGLLKVKHWFRARAQEDNAARLLVLMWLLVPLIFFSFSGSKLPGYILPVVPAAALISGERLTRFISGESLGLRAMQITGVLLVLFAIGGIIYALQSGAVSMYCALAITLPLVMAGLFVFFQARRRTVAAVLIVSVVLLSNAITLTCGMNRIPKRESVRDLIRMADGRGYGSARLYWLHGVDRTAEFYAAGRVPYGSDGEPVKFESIKEVEAVAFAEGVVLVLVPVAHVDQLIYQDSMNVEVIGDNGKFAIAGVSVRHGPSDLKMVQKTRKNLFVVFSAGCDQRSQSHGDHNVHLVHPAPRADYIRSKADRVRPRG